MNFWHLSDSDIIECADGDTSSGRQAATAAHLARCRRCADRVARVCEAAEAVQCVKSAAVPAHLRHRVARTLREESAIETSCEQAAPLLQECLDGCLSPFAAVALQQHLHTCTKCQTDLSALAAVTGAVRALPVVESAAEVRARVRAASRHAPRPVSVRLGWRPLVGAAAAALVIGALSLVRPAPAPQAGSQPLGIETEAGSSGTRPMEVVSLAPGEAAPADTEEVLDTGAEAPVVEHVEELLPQSAPLARTSVRLASTLPKGPAPALVTPQSSEPSVAMPAAFAALRAVKAASDEAAVRRAMELAGERFATLRSEELSEATLVQLPPVVNESPADLRATPSRARPEPLAAPAEPEAGSSESSGGITREGASLLPGPFV
jgi:anti-sigma factor RsiW